MTPVERLLREAPEGTFTDPAALSRVAAILRAQKANAPGMKPRAFNADLSIGTTRQEVA